MIEAPSEEKSLELVEDFNNELRNALASLAGKKPGLLDTYRFWSAKHLQRAVDGFVFLRRSRRVDGSKFLVRPAIEMMIRLQASQHPALFYRIAHSEYLQDKHLLRIAGDDAKLQAQNDKNWEGFKNAFVSEFPTVPIPDVGDRLTIEHLAKKAGLSPFYNGHYRIYCRYTHGALRASTGNIDEATDRADNQTMAVTALAALDNLISFGAHSSNRHGLAQRLEDITQRDST